LKIAGRWGTLGEATAIGRGIARLHGDAMGLGLALLRDLVELKRSGAIDGARRVVEIGSQQLADSFLDAPEIDEIYRLFGHEPVPQPAAVGAGNFTKRAPLARPFWTSLSLDHAAIDIDGDVIRLDLNDAVTPPELRGAFDLVINAGTTEHIANQANAFRVIHDLTGTGGVMYHEVPAGGMFDHGLVNYQPKFFAQMAQQNDYDVLFIKLVGSPPSPVPPAVRLICVGVPENIPDLTLRVALRKRGGDDFAPPIDAAPRFIAKRRRSIFRKIKLEIGRAMRRARAARNASPRISRILSVRSEAPPAPSKWRVLLAAVLTLGCFCGSGVSGYEFLDRDRP
jgi:SAM-dependent methyltransferase